MKKIQKNKKLFISLVIFALLIVLSSVFFYMQKSEANVNDNIVGWLWGGGTELDGASPFDGTNTNLGRISTSNITGGGSIAYGVKIPPTDGSLSGYAWSDNVGWIDFSGAQRSSNKIIGTVTFKSITDASLLGNSGGWSGRISLGGTAQDGNTYGISINPDNTLSGYAWSDELGWIDFSGAKIEVCVPDEKFTYSCTTPVCGECTSSVRTISGICSKTDSCGNLTNPGNEVCNNNGAKCVDVTCPACPQVKNNSWKEVAP